jgi:hypothetical protein
MKKIVKVRFDEGTHGSGMANLGDDSFGMQSDYDLQTLFESDPQEVRAFRESRRRAAAKVRSLAEDKIHDELVVIFGPEMSAKDAVSTLRHLIEKYKGLLTGRNEAGDYVMETVNGGKGF